jgi:hypothetical protein
MVELSYLRTEHACAFRRESDAKSLRGGLRVCRSGGLLQRPAAIQTELHQLWVSAREIEHEAHQMGGPGGTYGLQACISSN